MNSARVGTSVQRCRSCGAPLLHVMADLGMSPVSNAFLKPGDLDRAELYLPLQALVCHGCFLVQTRDVADREQHFHDDYLYFSSVSESWVEHARSFCAQVSARQRLGPQSFVVEIASNDGYLLQHFVKAGIPCLGIDPARKCAEAAREKYGVRTEVAFFGRELAARLAAREGVADLIVANNVLAHVPDLNDFAAGLAALLAPRGVASIEFPHLLRLIEGNQFDTIYHEHYSYLSLTALAPVFERHGLKMSDVEELTTHGGSLRLYVRHAAYPASASERLITVLEAEKAAGLTRLESYATFRARVHETKRKLLLELISLKRTGKRIVGYGAPAKGNTLLNYCGIGRDFVDYTVDRSPAKQGLFLPGTHIPILAPEYIFEGKPDVVFVLPWNIRGEVMDQMQGIRAWGGRFLIPIPEPVLL